MILIDEHANTKLLKALEAFKANPATARCIYFNLMARPAIAGLKEKIIESTRRHIGSLDPQVYLCGDGDIFILAPSIPSKDGKDVILDAADHAQMPASDVWVEFVELSLQINKLCNVAEEKLKKQQKIEDEKKKLLEQQQAERKRQEILNSGIFGNQEQIRNRRSARSTAELMIIEDDAFSRRLVDNVLQKKYSLTGLGEADHALDTYTRIAPDLLFLDINLPDVTGHELLEKILKLDPDAHVIMLSGNCDRENITQAMSKGAKGFIAKPFTKDKLFQYIDRCPSIMQKRRTETSLR